MVDEDFKTFFTIISMFGVLRPAFRENEMAMFQLKTVLEFNENDWKLFLLVLPDEKTRQIHILIKELYEYYLLYGGMLTEKSFQVRERMYQIIGKE